MTIKKSAEGGWPRGNEEKASLARGVTCHFTLVQPRPYSVTREGGPSQAGMDQALQLCRGSSFPTAKVPAEHSQVRRGHVEGARPAGNGDKR